MEERGLNGGGGGVHSGERRSLDWKGKVLG